MFYRRIEKSTFMKLQKVLRYTSQINIEPKRALSTPECRQWPEGYLPAEASEVLTSATVVADLKCVAHV